MPAVAARDSMRNPWAATARAGRFFFEFTRMACGGDERQFVGSRDNLAIADEIVRGLDTRVVAENLVIKLPFPYSCATIRQEIDRLRECRQCPIIFFAKSDLTPTSSRRRSGSGMSRAAWKIASLSGRDAVMRASAAGRLAHPRTQCEKPAPSL